MGSSIKVSLSSCTVLDKPFPTVHIMLHQYQNHVAYIIIGKMGLSKLLLLFLLPSVYCSSLMETISCSAYKKANQDLS